MYYKKVFLFFIMLLLSFTVIGCSDSTTNNNQHQTTELPEGFRLIGDEKIYSELGEEYFDLGYYMSDPDIIVYVNGSVNEYKLGTYKIEYYTLDSSGKKDQVLTREVTIVDTLAPQVKFVDDYEIIMGIFNPIFLLDSLYDGDFDNLQITSNIAEMIQKQPNGGIANVTVVVRDSSGNAISGNVSVRHEGYLFEKLTYDDLYRQAQTSWDAKCYMDGYGLPMDDDSCNSFINNPDSFSGYDISVSYAKNFVLNDDYYRFKISETTMTFFYTSNYSQSDAYMTILSVDYTEEPVITRISFFTYDYSDYGCFDCSYEWDNLLAISYSPGTDRSITLSYSSDLSTSTYVKNFGEQAIYDMYLIHLEAFYEEIGFNLDI
ncbi:MAG: immunoglobulin-like domain-containing protein [Candidatus Izemoplasmatales bacterium]